MMVIQQEINQDLSDDALRTARHLRHAQSET